MKIIGYILLIILFICMMVSLVDAQVVEEIYSRDGVFLGNLGSKYDINSINNPDGPYGNEFAPLKNEMSLEYMNAHNEFAWQLAPVVHWDGESVGIYNRATPWPLQTMWKAESTVQKPVWWWLDDKPKKKYWGHLKQ